MRCTNSRTFPPFRNRSKTGIANPAPVNVATMIIMTGAVCHGMIKKYSWKPIC